MFNRHSSLLDMIFSIVFIQQKMVLLIYFLVSYMFYQWTHKTRRIITRQTKSISFLDDNKRLKAFSLNAHHMLIKFNFGASLSHHCQQLCVIRCPLYGTERITGMAYINLLMIFSQKHCYLPCKLNDLASENMYFFLIDYLTMRETS